LLNPHGLFTQPGLHDSVGIIAAQALALRVVTD
jgi:hypothetical protein